MSTSLVGAAERAAATTDFDRDLERIAAHVDALSQEPPSAEQATRLAWRLYQRASLTGSFDELEAAEAAADTGLRRLGAWPDLWFVKANVDFKLHRLDRVARDLEQAPSLRDSPDGRLLRGDLDLQQGRYAEARRCYETVIREARTWDALARLAHLEHKVGHDGAADERYAEAADELTAKQMRSYAWVELQRGVVHLSRGRYEAAEAHFEQARSAYTGDWVADVHLGELRGAQGRFEEAVALVASAVIRAPRPELEQALGDLLVRAGRPDEARRWHDLALADYLDTTRRGGVHYYHHLVDFYADVRVDGDEAVRWALLDLGLRRNPDTLAALARACYRAGRLPEAVEAAEAALAFGTRDPHLLSVAGTIYVAAGRARDGELLLHEATELNPRRGDFHIHR